MDEQALPSVQDFKHQVSDLLNSLKDYEQRKNFVQVDVPFCKQQLQNILSVIFRTNDYDEQHLITYEKIKLQLGNKGERQYIYNKTGQQTRSRSKRQQIQSECYGCGHKLNGGSQCSNCGQDVIYITKLGSKAQDYNVKFDIFIEYFKCTSLVPYFLQNYINNVLLQEELTQDKEQFYRQSKKESSKHFQKNDHYFEIQFPLNCNLFYKRRSDITKASGESRSVNAIKVDEYQQRQMKIPVWSFRDFKNVMKKYRHESIKWETSSYLPRDFIFLATIYTKLYNINVPEISDIDRRMFYDYYKQIIYFDTNRRNKFNIQHIFIGLVQNIRQLQKYDIFLYFVKNNDINQELVKVIEYVMIE